MDGRRLVRLRRHISGFTLIELMITVALIGILASIAYPAYTGYLVRTRRAVAQGELSIAASAMERSFTTNGNYGSATTGTGAGVTFLSISPSDGGAANAYYNLRFMPGVVVASPSATTFLIRATPIAGSTQATDGYMEINQLGAKFWDRNNDGDVADANENNWNR